MYNYIFGKVTYIQGNYIVLENNNIGYQIRTPNPLNFTKNEEYKIYTYLHVREDIFDLYGFKTIEERELFLKLISVKGIGPKGALAILASGSIDGVIAAINSKDSKYLQRFPGIGPKASQQIILDLHGKIDFEEQNNQVNPKVKIIQDALRSMGYNQTEIKKVNQTIIDNLDKDDSELLRIILKNII